MVLRPIVVLAMLVSATAATAAAPASAPPVFPFDARACAKFPCSIDPYPAGSGDVTPSVAQYVATGAASAGAIQTQILSKGAQHATVLYSAYNADKTMLQTLWIEVMPARGGYHTVLRTCRDAVSPPCK